MHLKLGWKDAVDKEAGEKEKESRKKGERVEERMKGYQKTIRLRNRGFWHLRTEFGRDEWK